MNKHDWKQAYKSLGFSPSFWLIILILYCFGWIFGSYIRNDLFETTVVVYLTLCAVVQSSEERKKAKEEIKNRALFRKEVEESLLFGISIEDVYQRKNWWDSENKTKENKEFEEEEKQLREGLREVRNKIIKK
tara:strand:- start:498 stop:896 length:399 start_codon:yes stop_codon:yes gene_type:complete